MISSSLFVKRRARSDKRQVSPNCIPADPVDTLSDRINTLLNSSGPGYLLQLCPNTKYLLQSPIRFAAHQQEISTLGYPTGGERAILVVNGLVSNGTGHTTAVDGTCSNCSGLKLRNIQVDGSRAGAAPIMGGANIEFGGPNSDQLIEYVRSWDPRSWSCLHIAEGALNCINATIQNNDIGPAGSDVFQQWADGISIGCRNSIVRNNIVNNPTDGGIVLFGAPGTQVYNNTILVENQTLLGGINLVDFDPYNGDYSGTVVYNNTILGGFSTEQPSPGQVDGANIDGVVIKIGIAIGPRTWFGDHYGTNVTKSGTVINNQFSGAFSYAIAMSSSTNFTVQDNILIGNTSFIGARGPNCTDNNNVPTPAAFIMDSNNVNASSLQPNFQPIANGDSLTCVSPPDGGDYWPFGGNPYTPTSQPSAPPSSTHSSQRQDPPIGIAVGIPVGIILALVSIAILAWLIRVWKLRRSQRARLAKRSLVFTESGWVLTGD